MKHGQKNIKLCKYFRPLMI